MVCLQGIEDVFFLLHRVVSRALDLSMEAVIFSVCNRVIELLDGDVIHTSDVYRNTSDATSRSDFCSLHHLHTFEVLSRRSFYVNIYRAHLMRQKSGLATDRYMTPRKEGNASSAVAGGKSISATG